MYLRDSYLKELKAEVVKANGKYVVLDRTIFYPKSGGQPWDTGEVIRMSDGRVFKVIFVGKFEGDISHELDREGLKPGDRVRCKIDWERRYLFMRYHTACHVLSGVIHKETQALITGNQIDTEKTRIDFSLENFDRDEIRGFEEKANQVIERGLPVSINFVSREEVTGNPELVKLAKGIPESIKTIRIIEIKGFDRQACGGTHVKNTKEIGKIRIIKAENKGKNNRRIYFKLEP